ncbi:MAG TPA: response regulator [Anaeromyxobacter sp.]
MARIRWDRPDAFDHVVLLAAGDARLRAAIAERLGRVPGQDPGGGARGRHPRFKVVAAASAPMVRRRHAGSVSAAAVDLGIRGTSGLELIRELREARPELPILAYARGAPASEAIAAVMAGADFFHDCPDAGCAGVERALERAIDRRRLIAVVERSEAQLEEARGRLAQMSGELVRAVPGFRPLHSRGDVLPFREAARRYLLAAAQLFEGDPRALAKALGVSYFALRRLLARYDVPYPGARSRKQGTRGRWRTSTGSAI